LLDEICIDNDCFVDLLVGPTTRGRPKSKFLLCRDILKKNHKAAAAASKICKIEGEGDVNERTAQRFCNGYMDIKRFESLLRPTVWNIA
jgi:hypothetical protein